MTERKLRHKQRPNYYYLLEDPDAKRRHHNGARGSVELCSSGLGYLDEGFAAGIALPEDDYNKSLVGEVRKSLGTRVTWVPNHLGLISKINISPASDGRTRALQDDAKGFAEGERIAKASVWTLLALGVVEIAFSQLSGSIALLADGIDSISDAVVSFFVWTALRFTLKKPTDRFQYGYYKVESLAALLTAIGLMGIAGFISLRSYRALRDPAHTVALPATALTVLLIAGTVSLYRALQMRKIANRYNLLSLKIDAKNSIKDATSSYVAFGSVLVASFGLSQLDAVGGLVIAGYILSVAYVAIRESSFILLDAFRDPELTREIEKLVKSQPDVKGIRDLRLRRAGPFVLGALEIIVDGGMTVGQAHEVATQLQNSVKDRIIGLRRLVVTISPAVDPHEHTLS